MRVGQSLLLPLKHYRGNERDEEREYVKANMNTESFPTVNLLSDGKFIKYESEDRSVDALKAFATSKVAA